MEALDTIAESNDGVDEKPDIDLDKLKGINDGVIGKTVKD